MKDRQAVIVYLPAETKAHYQAIADREGSSLSAVLRRELIELERWMVKPPAAAPRREGARRSAPRSR